MAKNTETLKPLTFRNHWTNFFFSALIVLGLFYLAENNYLLFHSLVELFSIIIAGGIFIVAWNARRFLENHYLLFLGLAFLFIAALQTFHTVSYRGMGVFPGDDANLPTQLWIAARYFESISLLLAPIFITRTLNTRSAFFFFSTAFLLILGSIFWWKIFPVCYVEGQGLTLFKKISEYCISLLLLFAAFFFYLMKHEFEESTVKLMLAAIAFTIGAELAFTFYVSVYGLSNFIGHIFKIISVFLVYKALIETGFKKPYDFLFRKVSQSEKEHRLLLNNLQVGVVVYAPDTRILMNNPMASELLGLSDDQMQGEVAY